MEEKDQKIKAIELARVMVEELYKEIGRDAVEEAKAMGMATSIFSEAIEKKKNEFMKNVEIERQEASDIFDREVSRLFYE